MLERILALLGMRIREALVGRAGAGPGGVGGQARARPCSASSRRAWAWRSPAPAAWRGTTPTATAATPRRAFLFAPMLGIAGGTSEIQRNIIGERVLGLPKDPAVDKDVPFRDLLVGTQTK